MTNKKTKAEEEAEAAKRNAAADEADKASRPLNYNADAALDPAGEASVQRVPLADMPPASKKWFHDASHSADAGRLAAQRARDEAEFGIQSPGEATPPAAPPEAAK